MWEGVSLPGDIWREVLQEWIPCQEKMKTLSCLDVALCCRGARTSWWDHMKTIVWSDAATEEIYDTWGCNHSNSSLLFLRWVRARSVLIGSVSCCLCCLQKIEEDIPIPLSPILKWKIECCSKLQSSRDDTATLLNPLKGSRSLSLVTWSQNDELEDFFSIIAENYESLSALRCLWLIVPRFIEHDLFHRAIAAIGHQLSSLFIDSPFGSKNMTTVSNYCRSLRHFSLVNLDVCDEEMLTGTVETIANCALSLESVAVNAHSSTSTKNSLFLLSNATQLIEGLCAMNLPALSYLEITCVISITSLETLVRFLNRHPPVQSYRFCVYSLTGLVCSIERRMCELELSLEHEFHASKASTILNILSRWPHSISRLSVGCIDVNEDQFESSSAIQSDFDLFLSRHASTLTTVRLEVASFLLRLLLARCEFISSLELFGAEVIDSWSDSSPLPRYRIQQLVLSGIRGPGALKLLQCCPQLESLQMFWCSNATDEWLPQLERCCPQLRVVTVGGCDKILKESLTSYGAGTGVNVTYV